MISTRFEEYRRINDELPFVLHARLKRTAESLSRESNWHGELEIQLCLDGEGTVLLDGCAINIKKDDIIIDTDEKYKKEVISHFFKYGRLTQLPTQRKKREIVLMEIAKQFEAGKKYDEKAVNEVIHQFHEDHCTIRREMIACGIMKREKETYWLV